MRYDITCLLNDVGVQDLSDRIYVEDIKEDPKISIETANRAGFGLFPMTKPTREELTITVTIYVKERNRLERQAIFEKILGWCEDGGWLRTNNRPGQRIYVHCTKMPSSEVFNLSSRLEVEFSAYGFPYWQDIAPVQVASTGAVRDAAIIIRPNGTKDTFLEAEIAPATGTLTDVILTCGSQTITLTGLSATTAAPLMIYYDELSLLHIEVGGVSQLSKRTPASADDIILTAGVSNDVELHFSTVCTYTIKARGRWK